MSEQINILIPDELNENIQQLLESQSQSLEELVLSKLTQLLLPREMQNELDAIQYLSDDALWTIAKEQMPSDIQARANELMDLNTRGLISDTDYQELEALSERADRLMLRKAEAAAVLQQRGYTFTQADFKANA